MHRWIVILKDSQEATTKMAREKHFDEHFRFLETNFDRIIFSCGLRQDSGEEAHYVGGFWIVEANTMADVVELIDQDPYRQLGLRQMIDIYQAQEGYI